MLLMKGHLAAAEQGSCCWQGQRLTSGFIPSDRLAASGPSAVSFGLPGGGKAARTGAKRRRTAAPGRLPAGSRRRGVPAVHAGRLAHVPVACSASMAGTVEPAGWGGRWDGRCSSAVGVTVELACRCSSSCACKQLPAQACLCVRGWGRETASRPLREFGPWGHTRLGRWRPSLRARQRGGSGEWRQWMGVASAPDRRQAARLHGQQQ